MGWMTLHSYGLIEESKEVPTCSGCVRTAKYGPNPMEISSRFMSGCVKHERGSLDSTASSPHQSGALSFLDCDCEHGQLFMAAPPLRLYEVGKHTTLRRRSDSLQIAMPTAVRVTLQLREALFIY